MARRLWALIRKEFIQVGRDRRTLAMLIALPLLWLTVFGYAATFDVRQIPVGVANLSDAARSMRLVEALKTEETLRVAEGYRSREELVQAIGRGELRFGLVLPPGFGRPTPTPAEEPPPQPEVLADGSDFFATQAGLRVLSPALARGALPAGQAPVTVPRVAILYNPQLRSANVMIPALIGLVVMFITTLMTALGVVREKELGTLEQIVVSPITPLELILGKLIPYTLISLADLALVLLAGITLFDVPFAGNLVLFFGLSALFLLATLSTGLLVSTLAENQQQATQMAVFVLLPQFLLSGFSFPLTAMPVAIRYIAYLFPLTYFTPIARGIFLKGMGLNLLYQPALLLGIYGLAMTALAAARFRRRMG